MSNDTRQDIKEIRVKAFACDRIKQIREMNVNEHTETKGRFTYLSWAWGWQYFKGIFPNASFEKHTNADGYPAFFGPDGTAFVKVTVDIGEDGYAPMTELLYVMDNKNAPITNPSSKDINTALQRCLTKAMAFHGLGLYIYAGEDVPQGTEKEEVDSFTPPPPATPQPAPQPAPQPTQTDEDFEI